MEDFYWKTEKAHAHNMETMGDYLDNHLPDCCQVMEVDGTYAEIFNLEEKKAYAVHASGNGDFCTHKVEFEELPSNHNLEPTSANVSTPPSGSN